MELSVFLEPLVLLIKLKQLVQLDKMEYLAYLNCQLDKQQELKHVDPKNAQISKEIQNVVQQLQTKFVFLIQQDV